MTLVIHDATVVTVDAQDSVIYGGAVAIEAGRIAAVGPSSEILARYPQAGRIAASGKAVMPGFTPRCTWDSSAIFKSCPAPSGWSCSVAISLLC